MKGYLEELEQETWILRERAREQGKLPNHLFQQFDFTLQKIMEFGSTQVIKESVEAGLGISLLSQWAINKELMYVYIRNLR